jgi:dTDP-4-dehydrorhamnose 3,5-epimerase
VKRHWSEIDSVSHLAATAHADQRGNFTKYLDQPGDAQLAITQVGSAFNTRMGTVRGLHFQAQPHGETKRLWVSTGAIMDVLVDVRTESPTYGDWTSIELRAEEPAVLTVPAGVAHGYQTLVDDTTVVYLITGEFVPEAARTLLWSDPVLGIGWPLEVSSISDSDEAGQPWPVTY